MKVAVGFLIISSFLGSARGQEKGATLLDRFDKVPCSYVRATLDDFLVTLSEEPTTTGFVVLSDSSHYIDAVRRRNMVENHIASRNFDSGRIMFVRRSDRSKYELELWKVDKDSKLPFNYASEWTYRLPERAKPFVLITGGFDASECPAARDGELVVRFLKANPRSRLNIVVRCRGRDCFGDTKSDFVNELVATGGVARSRLKFYYVPIKTEYDTYEFWILN